MRTPWLPVFDWTDAPSDLNGLVLFAERWNLISVCVPSHFKRSLPRTAQKHTPRVKGAPLVIIVFHKVMSWEGRVRLMDEADFRMLRVPLHFSQLWSGLCVISGFHRDVNEILVLLGCYLVMEWPYMYNLPSTTAKLHNTLRMLSNAIAPCGLLHFVGETCRSKLNIVQLVGDKLLCRRRLKEKCILVLNILASSAIWSFGQNSSSKTWN